MSINASTRRFDTSRRQRARQVAATTPRSTTAGTVHWKENQRIPKAKVVMVGKTKASQGAKVVHTSDDMRCIPVKAGNRKNIDSARPKPAETNHETARCAAREPSFVRRTNHRHMKLKEISAM